MIRIVAVGDIMPGGVLALQSEYIQAGLRAFLDSSGRDFGMRDWFRLLIR